MTCRWGGPTGYTRIWEIKQWMVGSGRMRPKPASTVLFLRLMRDLPPWLACDSRWIFPACIFIHILVQYNVFLYVTNRCFHFLLVLLPLIQFRSLDFYRTSIHFWDNNTYNVRKVRMNIVQRQVTGSVYNYIYIETGAAGRDMVDQSFVENYTITGQKDVARALGSSERCHRTRVCQRSKSSVLDAVYGL